MRRLGLTLVVLACLASWSAQAAVAGQPRAYAARAVLVADGPSGEILYEENADRRLAMASITKLMTALVTLEHARPGDVVRVRAVASSTGESSVHLVRGERIRVRDLLAAALIESANDAAVALAAHVGRGSVASFVRLMNAEARELGLSQTHFARPDGLDTPGHYSSARDVLALARAAMEHAIVRRLVRKETAEIEGGRALDNWNDLLGAFPGTIGVKTGHTDRADWCQVAAVTRNGATVYAVVLGSPSRRRRNADLRDLLTWGLDQYGRVGVVSSERTYAEADVPFSDERVELVAGRGAAVTLPLWKPVVERVVAPAVAPAPLERGERVGEVEVLVDGRVVARRPLVVADAVAAPGWDGRLGWYADRTLDEAGSVLDDLLAAVT